MIHKGFDFSQMGGFPLNQQRLEHMQSAYAGLSDAMVGMIGDKAIVSGCVVNGNRVSDGWVVIGGELLPFVGGTQIATVIVKETKTNLIFKNGENKAVQFSKYATFGVGAEAVNWTDLVRIANITKLTGLIDRVGDVELELSNRLKVIAIGRAKINLNEQYTNIVLSLGELNEANWNKLSVKVEISTTFPFSADGRNKKIYYPGDSVLQSFELWANVSPEVPYMLDVWCDKTKLREGLGYQHYIDYIIYSNE